MTQGDQHHPSGTTAVGSSCPRDADAAERGSNSPLEERGRTMTEGRPQHHLHQHHPYLRPEQPSGPAADGDVRTLLHFVNLASSDIKAALDKSASSSRKSAPSAADNNRKSLPKPSKHSPPPPGFAGGAEFYQGVVGGDGDGPRDTGSGRDIESGFNSRRVAATLNSPPPNTQNGALHFSERLMASASLHRDHLFKNSDLSLVKEFAFGNNYNRRDPDQLLGRRATSRYLDRHHSTTSSACREFTDMSTLHHHHSEGERGGDRENPVPLRKRRLPASFWQEPDRSENHRTTKSGTMAGSSPMNLNANLKFPLLSSMAQGLADSSSSRPTSLDKNAIYPSSDQCYPALSLPFAPSLSNSLNSADGYLSRALNFQYSSICSCHQHADMYGYDHGPACAAYALRHGGTEAHGVFTPPGPLATAGLFSRWPHVPTPLTADRAADMCHPSTIPRVLKPIPTKSITSYPPRYHPIYT